MVIKENTARPTLPVREEIAEAARRKVGAHAHFAGRSTLFTFESNAGRLVIKGSVPTYYLKQLLQATLKDVPGVRRIDNQVRNTA